MQQKRKMREIGVMLGIFWGSLLLSGCATVQQVIRTLQPKLELKNVRVTGITFDALKLAVDVGIRNPNPVGLNMLGFDYELKLNDTPFLKDQTAKAMTIAALGDSDLEIPVTINYKNVYETFKALLTQDTATYQLGCGVSFNLPGLGETRFPLSTQGDLPLVKLPDIAVQQLKIKQLSLTGAKLELELRLKNANAFALLPQSLEYELLINGQPWASGLGVNLAQVTAKGEAAITLPLTLDFNQIGQTVTRAFASREPLNYRLRGKLGVGSALPLFDNVTIPLDGAGVIDISR